MAYYEPTTERKHKMESDQHINRAIEDLCRELKYTRTGSEKFNTLLDAITKLRASQNPTIVPPQ